MSWLCLSLNLQPEQGQAVPCCRRDVRDVREDNLQRSLLVVPVKQRKKSKSAAAPFEAYNSEQEVFLARDFRALGEGEIGMERSLYDCLC